MRGHRAVFAVAAGTILLAVCSVLSAFASPPIGLGIKDRHAPGSFRRSVLTEVPVYDEANRYPFQVDLRHYDLRNADLTGRLQDLIHADFDVYTQWPADLPDGFDPEKYMELGKNPGLGIRELHQRGITGKGVGIAIIDQTLLVDHVEYKDQLRHYEQLSYDEQPWRYEQPQFNDRLRKAGRSGCFRCRLGGPMGGSIAPVATAPS